MLLLINASSHWQDQAQWDEWAPEAQVIWADEGRPTAPAIEADRPLHPQAMSWHRGVLDAIDASNREGMPPHGIAVAGYVPAMLGVAHECATARRPIYAFIQRRLDNPPPDMKAPFVPAGVRWAPPPRFAAERGRVNAYAPEGLLHLAARPLTGARLALIAPLCEGVAVAPRKKRDLPILHTRATGLPDGDVEVPSWAVAHPAWGEPWGLVHDQAREICKKARSLRAGILFDGCVGEMALHVWAISKEQGVPLFFFRTEPARADKKFADPVRVERLPY